MRLSLPARLPACPPQTLSETTSYFLRNFAQGGGALAMMLYTSPKLCLIMMGVIPPVALWGVFFGRKVREGEGPRQVARIKLGECRGRRPCHVFGW